jgi:acetyl-CoA carboxylase biotin carboxyl carrier protein
MGLTRDDLRVLLDAFEASTWQEMTVETGGDRIHVSRRETAGHAPVPSPAGNGHVAAAVPAPAPAPAGSPGTTPAPAPAQAAPTGAVQAPMAEPAEPPGGAPVVSPSVGLFWRAPSPDAPPFVEVGSRVGADDTIGIVEVMKLMTPVAAGRAGTVSAVLVDNGDPVEHGQVLVLIAD